MNIIKYIELANKMSKHSTYPQKVGCIIVKGNKIIGLGYNKPHKTHPKSNNKFKNIHAELAAILNTGKTDLTGTIAIISRQYKNGTLALAKPCEHCQELLKSFGIKLAYYSCEEGYGKIYL